jgi:hypothetical protein
MPCLYPVSDCIGSGRWRPCGRCDNAKKLVAERKVPEKKKLSSVTDCFFHYRSWQRVRESNPIPIFRQLARFRWKLTAISALSALAKNQHFARFAQNHALRLSVSSFVRWSASGLSKRSLRSAAKLSLVFFLKSGRERLCSSSSRENPFRVQTLPAAILYPLR